MKSMFNSLIRWGYFNESNPSGRMALLLKSLIQEQKYINQTADKIFTTYQNDLEKLNDMISGLKETDDYQGMASLIEYRQAELLRALIASEIAIADTAELEREYMDWKRAQGLNRVNSGSAKQRMDILAGELKIRGRLQEVDSSNSFVPPETEPRAVIMDSSDEVEADQEQEFECPASQPKNEVLASEDDLVDYTLVDEESLVRHIRELTKELARHQSAPVVNQAETLRLAKEMRDKYHFLRRQDKKMGKKRDRLAMVDDLRHIF